MSMNAATEARLARERVVKKAKILEGLEATGVISLTCKRVGTTQRTYYNWRDQDEEFAEAADEALARSSGQVMAELRRRAMGYEIPVFYKGEPIWKREADGSFALDENFERVPYTNTAYSDRLLERLAEATDHRFRRGGGGISIDPSQLPKEVRITFVCPEGRTLDDYDEEGHIKPDRS